MESHSQLRRFQFALMVSLWMLYTNRAVPSLKLAACLLVKSVPWSGKELKSTVSLPGDALLIHLAALNQNYPPQCKKWASPSTEVHSASVSPPERARSMLVPGIHDLHRAGCANRVVKHHITEKIHLSGLIGTGRHPDMQKIRIIGIFHWK